MKAFADYTNPALATDLVVFGYQAGQLSLLLLKRSEAPFKGEWTLPGAFLRMEETLAGTCRRILREKLGTGELWLEQLYSFDDLQRDPRGRVISVAYLALVNPAGLQLSRGAMAEDLAWFSTTELPATGFDHAQIITRGLERLQSKILYQPAGFELLNQEFTLPELQTLYETILGRTIDRRNFRRKLLDAGYILATGRQQTGAQNRRPDLYVFNKAMDPKGFLLNL